MRSRERGGVPLRVTALALGSLLAGPAMSCSSDSSARSTAATAATAAGSTISAPPIAIGDAPVRVELIREAVAAAEAELGGPQQFFEVNASPTIVNVFVAIDGATRAVAYVYAAGVLGQRAAAEPASGPTFASSEIDFDETLVLAQVRSELADSDFRLFSITALEPGGVQYRTVIKSAQGAEFVVSLSSDGVILGTDQSLGIGDS